MTQTSMEYPGPYCQSASFSTRDIEARIFTNMNTQSLSNGLALELKAYVENNGLTSVELVHMFSAIDENFKNAKQQSVQSKLVRLQDQIKKLASKKKVKGVRNLKELLDQQFVPPCLNAGKLVESACVLNNESQSDLKLKTDQCTTGAELTTGSSPVSEDETSKQQNSVASQTYVNDCDKQLMKEENFIQYKITKGNKHNQQLKKQILEHEEKLENVQNRIGHYAIRNVNKRDEKSKQNLHALRKSQRLAMKQNKQLSVISGKLSQHRSNVKEMRNECTELNDKICALVKEKQELVMENQSEKCKKQVLQKNNSYMKKEIVKLREQRSDNVNILDIEDDNNMRLNAVLTEKDAIINDLEEQLSTVDSEKENIVLKNTNGSYSENVRLCIMELSGLEVAVEKVSRVIQTVAKHIFSESFKTSQLPTPSTVQAVVDEGHFVAKTFIAEKINNVDNWGLGRDGTTRRKEKILDTSVTLDTGDVISLGFNRVANETAETINNITKRHIEELASLHDINETEYVANALQKLSFTMSDRASNEKKADRILDEWRNEILSGFVGDVNVVHNFHCMAHVLLGFHSYSKPEIKELESTIVDKTGPIGRDNLSVFKTWSKKETFPERAVRTTSDVFGPAGDHYGVRDRWDAHCSENGIKSIIGNYRDNRFNALFETSAHVFLHRHEFIKVLKTVDKPNLKLKAVTSDLESNEVAALLQCLGLFYLKLTGPYWNFVTCGKVPYLEVYRHVQDIQQFLQKVEQSPEQLLVIEGHWSKDDPLDIGHVAHHARLQSTLFTLQEDTRDLLLESIPRIARAMSKVIEKQLGDFLPGGKFTIRPDDGALHRTKFAPITNLGCEHHFGDLDSSQKRRPHASYHHHSSVQLLKRNQTQLMGWVDEMSAEKKSELLMSARKGGRQLRKTHMQNEKQVLKQISDNMVKEQTAKGKKRTRKCKSSEGDKINKRQRREDVEEPEPELNLPHTEGFVVNEYVAVAYQDNWYPGCIDKVVDNETAIVKFMTPCRKDGYYQWPSREDKQTVKMEFVLSRNVVPDCVGSGRQYYVKEYDNIDKLYMQYHSTYFG